MGVEDSTWRKGGGGDLAALEELDLGPMCLFVHDNLKKLMG